MKKIISLFQRNYNGDHLVRNEVVPGAEWVLAGEGVATRKFDGTSEWVYDWDSLNPRYKWLAVWPDGEVMPFLFEPKIGNEEWIVSNPNDGNVIMPKKTVLKKGIKWRNSLQKRPK